MKCKGITKKGKVFNLKGPYCRHHCEITGPECSICLENISPMYSLSVRCGHVFHSKCINKWIIHGGNSCPMCRTKFVPPVVVPRPVVPPPVVPPVHHEWYWYTFEYLRSLWR